MAERRNYYEIINDLKIKPLPFDSSLPAPPDKIIQAAIEQWNYLSKLQGSISNESANSAQRRQELDMYEEIKLCFRDSKTRKVEADEMMKKQLEKLKGVIDILKEGSNEKKPLAPHAMIKSLADHLHLARPTVEKVFEASGFDMTKPEVKDINNILIASAVMENIDNSIRILSSQFNKACPWIKKGGDLYVLAAYYDILAAKEQSNPEVNPDTLVNNLNVASYQSKPAETLKNILHKASSRISGLNGDMWHEVKALCSIGESKIFSSNDAKTAYDNSLALKKLDGLFLLLKKLPLELKKDTRIAEVCIQKIQSIGSNFSDPDIARAIYNQKADLKDDPYESDSEVGYVCANCRTITKIKYSKIQKDKDKLERVCEACNMPLFQRCTNCSRVIPATAEVCPGCRFNIAESKKFEKYFALAQIAIASTDIAEAKKQLALAKNARPNDPKLKGLEAELNKIVQRYEAPLQEIKNLMNQKRYMEANKKLEEFCVHWPGARVDTIRTQIDSKIAEADKLFDQLRHHSDPCGVCFDILDKIKDYTKAWEFIKGRRPTAVTGLTAAISEKNGQVALQWTGTGERNVSYRVVRKENSMPRNINDGTIVLNNQLAVQHIDTSISAGTVYYYAVFAERSGVYSTPVTSKACILLQELDKNSIIKVAEEGSCAFSWQLPKNCRGVRILRNDRGIANAAPGGTTKVIAERAVNGYVDRTVGNGTNYNYRLQCIYNVENDVQYSEGITFSLMPESRPMSVTLTSAGFKGSDRNTVHITWDYTHDIGNSRMDIYDIVPGISIAKGTVYPVGKLTELGRKMGTVPNVSAKSFELRITQEQAYRLCAVMSRGEYAAVSNCIPCSNYGKLEFEKKMTKIDGDRLYICLKKDLPQDVTGIRYMVDTKSRDNEPAPWHGIEDIPKMSLLPISTYRSDGAIIIERVPKKVLYISIIGEYRIGQNTFYSEPSYLNLSNMPKAEISYKLVWGPLKQKKNVKLIIECDTDTTLPEMLLCCSRTIEIPLSTDNADIIQICRVPKDINYTAHTRKEIQIPNEVWRETTRGNELRLFLLEDRKTEFNMKPDRPSLKIP